MSDKTNQLRQYADRSDVPGDIRSMMIDAADTIDVMEEQQHEIISNASSIKEAFEKINSNHNTMVEALKNAEHGLVAIYNGFAPQAQSGDTNLFADRDPVVIFVRAALSNVEPKL
jgi:hypothetical protein